MTKEQTQLLAVMMFEPLKIEKTQINDCFEILVIILIEDKALANTILAQIAIYHGEQILDQFKQYLILRQGEANAKLDTISARLAEGNEAAAMMLKVIRGANNDLVKPIIRKLDACHIVGDKLGGIAVVCNFDLLVLFDLCKDLSNEVFTKLCEEGIGTSFKKEDEECHPLLNDPRFKRVLE